MLEEEAEARGNMIVGDRLVTPCPPVRKKRKPKPFLHVQWLAQTRSGQQQASKKTPSTRLGVCVFVCLSVCLFVCLSVCLFILYTGRRPYAQGLQAVEALHTPR